MSDLSISEKLEKTNYLGMQSQNENVKKFHRVVERSKNIELDNIEELINGEYEIDRSNILKVIKDDKCKFISIQGADGSGKYVICKQLLKDEGFVLATRSENFAKGKRINEIWNCDIEDIII